jgi:hypothetical protein
MFWFSPRSVEHRLRPDEPFDAEYPLSLIDGVMPRINSRYLFVYDTRGDMTTNVTASREALVKRLRTGLQPMLRLPEEGVLALPELLGTIYENKTNGMLSLKVTKASTVSFVVSTRDDMNIQNLKPEEGFPRQCLDPNIYATGIEPISMPSASVGSQAFSAQLTFIKGGFVLCVNKHHSLLDATSSSRLIKWWFNNARTSADKPEICPFMPAAKNCVSMHDRKPLTEARPVAQQQHPNWRVNPGASPTIFGLTLPPAWVMTALKWIPFKLAPEARSHIIYFNSDSLHKLKKATETSAKIRISTNDALIALVWKSVIRARFDPSKDPADSTSSVSVSVNIRNRIEPKLPDEYFGNAVISLSTELPISHLLDSSPASISDAACEVRRTLSAKADDANIRSQLQLMAMQKKISDLRMNINPFNGNDLYMNSWEGLWKDMADLDLGYGKFQRMRLPGGNAFSGLANVLPAYGMRDASGDGVYPGGLEVMVDLAAAHMERLLADEEFMRYVSKII